MRNVLLSSIASFLSALCLTISCNSGPTGHDSRFGMTLRDYARQAKQKGSRQALLTYADDEEEGQMLYIASIEEAMSEYDWIVGEPVDEKTLLFTRGTHSSDPDSIYTVYRLRVTKRLGHTKHPHQQNSFEKQALQEMPIIGNEVLVAKSGGNVFIDGILLKKRGSSCFSELLPRPYLLALAMDTSGQVGWLQMGCRSIYSIDKDRLQGRDTNDSSVTIGMRNRFANSLAAFSKALETSQSTKH